MKFMSLCFILAFAFVGATSAPTRKIREIENPQTEVKQEGSKIQEQLLMAFDSFKRSVEELTSKINTEEIVSGVQNLTSMLENYAKKTADQLASTASNIGNTEEKKEP